MRWWVAEFGDPAGPETKPFFQEVSHLLLLPSQK